MKNKIARIKQFVNEHPEAYYWSCGLITGAATVFVAMHTPHRTDMLRMTVDQAKELIEDSDVTMKYELPKQTIFVMTKP